MTPYMRNRLTRKYARELAVVDSLLREAPQVDIESLHAKTNWSRTRCNDVLVTAHMLGRLSTQNDK